MSRPPSRASRAQSALGRLCAVWLGLIRALRRVLFPLILEFVRDWARETHRDLASTLRPFEIGLGLLILAASACSGAIGYGAVLRGKEKAHWLLNRFWCERLRQLHFQIIVNNLQLAADALREPAAMGRYLALRSEYLTLFREEFGSSAKDRLDGLENDLAESDPWISPRWESPAPRPTTSDEMDVLLTVFAHQRFGIQKRFCAKKLSPGWYSPSTRARVVVNASNSLTVLLLGLSITTALTYLGAPDRPVVLLALAGRLRAHSEPASRAMGVLNEGLQVHGRY